MHTSELDILDYLGESIFVVDVLPKNTYVYLKFNQANARMSGRDPAALVGKSPKDIFPERVSKTLINNFQRVQAAKKPITYEIVIPFPTGERRLRTTLSPMTNDAGIIYRLVGLSIDITRQHAEIVAQLQLDVQSQELNREMEQFVSMAAHDLRSPMQNIQALAEALRDDFIDHGDGKMQLIDLLINVAQKGSALIADVLSYSRARQVSTSIHYFDFSLMCSNIFAILDPKEQHHLTGTGARLIADEVAVQIILRNLVDNAIKHSGRTSVTVSIDVKKLANDTLRFRVRDNGRGMENPATAFLDGGEFKYGTGFGLLGIRQLIKTRGGEISAKVFENKPGTEFRFTLPGKIVPEQENPVQHKIA